MRIEDKNRKEHYHICVNDIPLVQWFRQKANEWRNGLGITSTKQDKGLKIWDILKNPFLKQIKTLKDRGLSQKIPIFVIELRQLFYGIQEEMLCYFVFKVFYSLNELQYAI